jgi:hypothetical protein
MRCKAILPALLALLLIGNPCFAAACQFACGEAAAAGCHEPAGDGMRTMPSSVQAMAGMKHCAMCAHPAAVSATEVSCSQQLCAAEPAVAARGNLDSIRPVALAPLCASLSAALPATCAGVAEKLPPLPPSQPPLHLILRV